MPRQLLAPIFVILALISPLPVCAEDAPAAEAAAPAPDAAAAAPAAEAGAAPAAPAADGSAPAATVTDAAPTETAGDRVAASDAGGQKIENGEPDPNSVDFESEETFIDASDAVKSKQYVHRAILSSIIRDTARTKNAGFYVNHLMGFSNVWQRAGEYDKFFSGIQGVSLGYITAGGHGFEAGLELSTVSDAFIGYRYVKRLKNYTVWPFVGVGTGMQLDGLSLADGPPESKNYTGSKQMFFLNLGLLLPIVDVAAKAEIRFQFYGLDRIIFSQGIGVIVFL